MAIEIQVRNKHSRFSFDGQIGIVVLAKTPGTISALTLEPLTTMKRLPKLTVYWEAVMIQKDGNKESSTYQDWGESGVAPEDLEFVRSGEATP